MKTIFVLGPLLLFGCARFADEERVKILEDKVTTLQAEQDMMMSTILKETGRFPARLQLTSKTFSFARDDAGLTYGINIDKVSNHPAGIEYRLGVTNFYGVSLTDVVLTAYAGEYSGSAALSRDLPPGTRAFVDVIVPTGPGGPPEAISVEVMSGGIRFSVVR